MAALDPPPQLIARACSLTIHSAKDLKAADVNGYSDPYVRISTPRGPDLESPVVWKTLNPVWEHVFSLNQLFPGDSITLDVWDRDLIGSDDFLGRAVLRFPPDSPLKDVRQLELELQSRVVVKHGKPRRKDKGVKGVLLLSLAFSPVASLGPSGNSADSLLSLGRAGLLKRPLRITLHCGNGLKAADLNGKADPYVLMSSGEVIAKSPIIAKTLNPVWEYHIDLPDFAPGHAVRFEVRHKGSFRDKFLGQAVAYFSKKVPLEDREHFLLSLLPRRDSDKAVSGNLDVSFLFGPPIDPSATVEPFVPDPIPAPSQSPIEDVSTDDEDHPPTQDQEDQTPKLTPKHDQKLSLEPSRRLLSMTGSAHSSALSSVSFAASLSLAALPERLTRVSGFNVDQVDYAAIPSLEEHGRNYGVTVPNFRDVGGWPVRYMDTLVGFVRTGRMKARTLFRTSAIMRATEQDAKTVMNTLGIRTLFDLRTPDCAGCRGPYLTKFFAVHQPARRANTWRESKSGYDSMSQSDSRRTRLKSMRQQQPRPEAQQDAELEDYASMIEEAVFDWASESAEYGADKVAFGNLYLHCLIGSAFRTHVVKKAKKTRLISAGLTRSPAEQKRAICGPIFDRPNGLEVLYRMIIDDCQSEFGALFQHFLDPAVYPVAWFCNHGKDRTGLTAAFLQLICGLDRPTVIDGYQLSDYFLRPLGPIVDEEMYEAGMNPAIMSRTPAWVLTNTLGYIDRRYGGVEQYLVQCGFSLSDQSKLRTLLVDWDHPLTPEYIQATQRAMLAKTSPVTITVHRAAQLKAADLNGYSDPFVVIKQCSTIPNNHFGKGDKPKTVGQSPVIWTSLGVLESFLVMFSDSTSLTYPILFFLLFPSPFFRPHLGVLPHLRFC